MKSDLDPALRGALDDIYRERGGIDPGIGDDIALDFVAYEILIDVERRFGVALDEADLSAPLLRDRDRLGALIQRLRDEEPITR